MCGDGAGCCFSGVGDGLVELVIGVVEEGGVWPADSGWNSDIGSGDGGEQCSFGVCGVTVGGDDVVGVGGGVAFAIAYCGDQGIDVVPGVALLVGVGEGEVLVEEGLCLSVVGYGIFYEEWVGCIIKVGECLCLSAGVIDVFEHDVAMGILYIPGVSGGCITACYACVVFVLVGECFGDGLCAGVVGCGGWCVGSNCFPGAVDVGPDKFNISKRRIVVVDHDCIVEIRSRRAAYICNSPDFINFVFVITGKLRIISWIKRVEL